ncbi:unnamed protein product [Lactuca saligna]|uniref:Transcriptional coactivator Hfi1/Transcriptional adapter 1 n=1 Tax=Lactuca saligna TaxID=75948 RepID=A0AA36DZU6_LACSI|nr:unnamed protein product [Lactuca saligna]
MPAVRHCSRIDTFELKLHMERRLGSQKAQKYFNLLTRYLSQKLRKPEFDKLCISLIGKENLRLHNELIKSLLKNATLSKTPPKKVNPNNTLSQPSSRFANERKVKDHLLSQQQSATELFSLGSKPPIEVNSVEDGEEVEQISISPGIHSRSPVKAPFGIKIHSKDSKKVLSISSPFHTCHYNSQLPPTSSLSTRLKHKLKTEGLDITMDCVNLVNNGLDSFLKRVIKPCLELGRSRSLKNQERLFPFSSSMVDLRVLTESNPKILGEDWGIELEKICLFESR